MPGLRELHKGRRRRAILDAARALLREGGPDGLTVEVLAARAEVAPATVYNLIGPRDALYSALLDDLLDQLTDRLASADHAGPLDRARDVVDESTRLFVTDPAVWRPVVARLGPALRHRPSELLAAAFAEAGDAGLLHPSADPDALGTQVLIAVTGAMLLWACGQADDAGLVALARAGLDLALAAALVDEDARTAHLVAASTATCAPPGPDR